MKRNLDSFNLVRRNSKIKLKKIQTSQKLVFVGTGTSVKKPIHTPFYFLTTADESTLVMLIRLSESVCFIVCFMFCSNLASLFDFKYQANELFF